MKKKKFGKEPKPKDSYNTFKDFQGVKYTGMKVGRRHSWKYAAGEWKEKKITPDLWEFTYAVKKKRKGKAPEGSGVDVGTEYHWYILAHQNVCKLDANTYSTAMRGYKYKVAHKRANKDSWNCSYRGQRRRLIALFRSALLQLEQEELEELSKKGSSKKQSKIKLPFERQKNG